MTDPTPDTTLNLVWTNRPDSLVGVVLITNDPLPEFLLMSQDLWQALHDPTAWAWLSESPDRSAERPTELDHGHTLLEVLAGTTQYWAHFDAANLWASYKVVGVQADAPYDVALKLESWEVKNEDLPDYGPALTAPEVAALDKPRPS